MADHDEPTLRNALDAVNRTRKWALIGMTSLVFLVAIALVVLSMAVVIPSTQQGVAIGTTLPETRAATGRLMPASVLWISLAAQLFFVACGTVAVMLHVSRMTRAILRGIEASKK